MAFILCFFAVFFIIFQRNKTAFLVNRLLRLSILDDSRQMPSLIFSENYTNNKTIKTWSTANAVSALRFKYFTEYGEKLINSNNSALPYKFYCHDNHSNSTA